MDHGHNVGLNSNDQLQSNLNHAVDALADSILQINDLIASQCFCFVECCIG
jgi:hypothetical protein